MIRSIKKQFHKIMGNSSSHTHEPLERGFTRGGKFGDVKNSKAASFRFSKKSPKKMERLRRSFRDSFRRRRDRVPESSKPHQWSSDEQAVRSNTCSFGVKYLGCIEVFESRGMQVCEEALKILRESKRRPVRGLLHVSGDGLRVVDDDTKGLLVDQTIEKVSFCAPDRNHERGFSYICRDGTTRRWMLHGFLAIRDSGERLSHAVGCAFAVCLERKQRRDKECGVTMTFDVKNSTFTRQGSFRQTTMTERLACNERGIDTFAVPISSTSSMNNRPFNPFAIERPHATQHMLERQGSFRAFSTIGTQSPFKRQMSLRINDLPSNAERQKAFLALTTPVRSVSPIPEVSPPQPSKMQQQSSPSGSPPSADTVSQLCQELSQGLSLLTQKDENMDDLNFNNSMSVNQNILAASSGSTPTTPTAKSPSNGYGSMYEKTPPTAEVSPAGNTSPTTPITSTPINCLADAKTPSPITTTPTSTRTATHLVEAVTPLPKPDQWLGRIVQNTSPTPTTRRPPSLALSGRTKSLQPSSITGEDPFNSEWVAGGNGVTKPVQIHHTNPFISPPKPQSFQVQL